MNPINRSIFDITKPTGNNSTEKLVLILWNIFYVCLTNMVLKSSVQYKISLFWFLVCYEIKQNHILQYLGFDSIDPQVSFYLLMGISFGTHYGDINWQNFHLIGIVPTLAFLQQNITSSIMIQQNRVYILHYEQIDPVVMMHSTCHKILA